MANIPERVTALIQSTVEAQGVSLWDVRFVKEGAAYYLRVFIDKPEGISIDDCTNVSHAIDPLLDEADPIDGSYYLEVCSPGIDRELTKPAHYRAACGKTVSIRLFQAVDGQKEWRGILRAAGERLVLETAEGVREFPLSAVAKTTWTEES